MNKLDTALDKLYCGSVIKEAIDQPIKIGTVNFSAIATITTTRKLVMQFLPKTLVDLDNARKNPGMANTIVQFMKQKGLSGRYIQDADGAGFVFEIDLFELANILR